MNSSTKTILVLINVNRYKHKFFSHDVLLPQPLQEFTWINYIPPNIGLDEDVLKTFWKRLSPSSSAEVFKTSSRRLDQDKHICHSHTSSEDVFKTSSRRFGQDQCGCLGHRFSRCLQDVFKTYSRHLEDIFWKRLQDVFKTSSRCFEDVFQTSWKDIFKTFSRRIIKLNCSC